MRFWVVTALRYIKSEEITPVELMTANELGSQPAHSARSGLPSILQRCRSDDRITLNAAGSSTEANRPKRTLASDAHCVSFALGNGPMAES
ncbi:MAG: hypothetical protein RLY91_1866 [Pseudomonadota bacterium]|jgi:hypothetical protein